MKKILAFALVVFFIIGSAFTQVKPVVKSNIQFQIKNLGINTGGTIGGMQANIHIDPAQLNTSVVEATVATNTINTDNDKRDEHLRSEDYFNVAKYPTISMKMVSIKHKGGDKYSGKFNLTIKDKTKQIEVPFTYTENGTTASVNGTFKINRLDFGVGSSSLVLGNDVTVTIAAEVTK
jgi:polyisoprenoid-binding protein YceI